MIAKETKKEFSNNHSNSNCTTLDILKELHEADHTRSNNKSLSRSNKADDGDEVSFNSNNSKSLVMIVEKGGDNSVVIHDIQTKDRMKNIEEKEQKEEQSNNEILEEEIIEIISSKDDMNREVSIISYGNLKEEEQFDEASSNRTNNLNHIANTVRSSLCMFDEAGFYCDALGYYEPDTIISGIDQGESRTNVFDIGVHKLIKDRSLEETYTDTTTPHNNHCSTIATTTRSSSIRYNNKEDHVVEKECTGSTTTTTSYAWSITSFGSSSSSEYDEKDEESSLEEEEEAAVYIVDTCTWSDSGSSGSEDEEEEDEGSNGNDTGNNTDYIWSNINSIVGKKPRISYSSKQQEIKCSSCRSKHMDCYHSNNYISHPQNNINPTTSTSTTTASVTHDLRNPIHNYMNPTVSQDSSTNSYNNIRMTTNSNTKTRKEYITSQLLSCHSPSLSISNLNALYKNKVKVKGILRTKNNRNNRKKHEYFEDMNRSLCLSTPTHKEGGDYNNTSSFCFNNEYNNNKNFDNEDGEEMDNYYNDIQASKSDIVIDPTQRAGIRLLNEASITIQSCTRRYLTRVFYLTQRLCCVVIQTYTRRWMAQRLLYKLRVAVIPTIQRSVRRWIAIRKVQIRRNEKYTSDIGVTQSVIRRWLCTSHYTNQRNSIIRIQSIWRMYCTRTTFEYELMYILLIQSISRRYIATKKCIQIRKQNATIKIQMIYKSHVARQTLHHLKLQRQRIQCSIILQTCSRAYIARILYQNLKHQKLRYDASIRIQTRWRGYDTRITCLELNIYVQIQRNLIVKRRGARIIQKLYRKYLGRKYAAVRIQSIWRGYFDTIRCIMLLVQIITVQNHVRSYLAKKQYHKRKAQKLHSACIRIQKAYRYYSFRKSLQFHRMATKFKQTSFCASNNPNKQTYNYYTNNYDHYSVHLHGKLFWKHVGNGIASAATTRSSHSSSKESIVQEVGSCCNTSGTDSVTGPFPIMVYASSKYIDDNSSISKSTITSSTSSTSSTTSTTTSSSTSTSTSSQILKDYNIRNYIFTNVPEKEIIVSSSKKNGVIIKKNTSMQPQQCSYEPYKTQTQTYPFQYKPFEKEENKKEDDKYSVMEDRYQCYSTLD